MSNTIQSKPAPRKPWTVSKQAGMIFVLSKDGDIILGSDTCDKLGESLCQYICDSVNSSSPIKNPKVCQLCLGSGFLELRVQADQRVVTPCPCSGESIQLLARRCFAEGYKRAENDILANRRGS